MKKLKIRWVTWWPIRYWTDRFEHLAKQPGINLEVLFLRGRSTQLENQLQEGQWGFKYTFLSRKADDTGYSRLKFSVPKFIPLVRGQCDALVLFYADPTPATAALWCIIFQKRFYIFAANTKKDFRDTSLIKEQIKRFILQRAKGVLVTGPLQKDYVSQYQRDLSKIHIIGNPVGSLQQELPESRDSKNYLRKKFHWEDTIVILFVGRLVAEKGLFTLLETAQLLVQQNIFPKLVFVGSGPLKQSLKRHAELYNLDAEFLGFLEGRQLAERYAAADIFVLPSVSEPWGLVVNEAMEFELPIVVSSNVGCAPVLLDHGKNGYIFRVNDAQELAQYLTKLCRDGNLMKVLGQESKRKIKEQSIKAWSAAVIRAIEGSARENPQG